jgi:hypothetical protein
MSCREGERRMIACPAPRVNACRQTLRKALNDQRAQGGRLPVAPRPQSCWPAKRQERDRLAGACSIMIVPDTSSPVARCGWRPDVEPAAPDAELLPQVTAKPLAPAVNAYGIATEGSL